MAQLTRKQQAAIENALHHLNRALKFIYSEDVAVARRDKHGTTTLHYYRISDHSYLYEINKDIGSELTGLGTGIHYLNRLLGKD